VRVLIFHGYLLHGTGSNVYNAEVGAALARAGHEVHLVCQDRDPLDLPWVDASATWDDQSRLRVDERRAPARATVYRPDIGGLLPVYVADRYDGIEARAFPELSDAELERYLARNVAAVREVAERARPHVALANHLVMGPVVLARALSDLRVPYAVKIHGSALEYTVKPFPRFLPYAEEGLAGARGVLCGSRHTAESLWATIPWPELPERTRLGPPGVDVERFAPRAPAAAAGGLRALTRRLAAGEGAAPPGESSSFARDTAEAARALARLDPARDRLVVYVGKLIGSKGVELLLAAWPRIAAAHPDAKLVIVGFGAFRTGLERLAGQLAAGDLGAARATVSESGAPLPLLDAFLATGPGLPDAHRALTERVVWTGRLDHSELADLLPAAEAMVVPSTFPESFGMVAAEAAACGVLPVVAAHSGLAEVAGALAAAVPAPARDLLAFDLGPSAVEAIAGAVSGWLSAAPSLRADTRRALVETTRARWSWDGVARAVLAAAEGRLDELPRPA
jgi:glycosyltransferase involved in cell wall biosynthesis